MKKINSITAIAVLGVMGISYANAAPFKPVTTLSDGTLRKDTVPAPIVKIGNEYELFGIKYTPKFDENYDVIGIASWYGEDFHGKLTSNGEIFDMEELTAAHPTLQLPSFVEVTNLENGKRVIVRVNDRGPFSGGRQIDLSKRAAELLDFKDEGTANVRIRLLKDISNQAAEELNSINAQRSRSVAPLPITPAVSEEEVQDVLPNLVPVAELVKEEIPSVTPVDAEKLVSEPEVVKISLEEPNGIKKYIPRGVFVQVGAFSQENNLIKDHMASLSEMGVVSLQKVDINGNNILRLRVGPYGSIDDAVKIKDKLVSLGYGSSRVVVEQ